MRTVAAALLTGLALGAPAADAREVVSVANAEGGTVSIVDAHTFDVLRTIDVVPDGRDPAPQENPTQALAGQRVVEAAGGENLAQDQDLSPDGRTLYVSRGHRADVAAFDVATGALRWKVPISGVRSDHMTLSRDGRRLFVSALTQERIEVVDTQLRRVVAAIPSGEWPHDNHLNEDGTRLYNASIGNILTPAQARRPSLVTVADPRSLAVQRTIAFDRGVRPFEVTQDEQRLYAQLSEDHAVHAVDLRTDERRRLALPIDAGVTDADYDFEAPHHGLALSEDETTLCLAGRASDYVAFVSAPGLELLGTTEVPDAPGWALAHGEHCFVPSTRADTLSVLSFGTRQEVARVTMGDGPKHLEAGTVPEDALCASGGVKGCGPPLRLTRRCAGPDRLRVRLTGDAHGVRDVEVKLGRRKAGTGAAAVVRTRGTRARVVRALVRRAGEPRRLVLRRTLPRC